MTETEHTIGGLGSVDHDVAHAIYQSIQAQHAKVPFKHGATAAYWHVIHTLNTLDKAET